MIHPKNSKSTWLVQYVEITVSETFVLMLVHQEIVRMLCQMFLNDTFSSYFKY